MQSIEQPNTQGDDKSGILERPRTHIRGVGTKSFDFTILLLAPQQPLSTSYLFSAGALPSLR